MVSNELVKFICGSLSQLSTGKLCGRSTAVCDDHSLPSFV